MHTILFNREIDIFSFMGDKFTIIKCRTFFLHNRQFCEVYFYFIIEKWTMKVYIRIFIKKNKNKSRS